MAFDYEAFINGLERKAEDEAARVGRRRKKERVLWGLCGVGHAGLTAAVWVVFGPLAGLWLVAVYGGVALSVGLMCLVNRWLKW